MLIPVILLAGLVAGASALRGLIPNSTSSGPCSLGNCPLELRKENSDERFIYGVTTRFTVVLNDNDNPQGHLHCVPDGIIGAISNVPPESPPLYAARFEGVAPGSCALSDDNFSATIVIQ
jgi:hypothetical protein